MITAADDRIAVVREVYAAINEHDLVSIERLLAVDCVRHFPKGGCPIAGDHVGRDKVLASFAYVVRLTGSDYHIDVGGVLARDEIVASYHHESGSRIRDAARLDSDMLVRWRVDGGRVAEIWDYANDVPHLNDFLS